MAVMLIYFCLLLGGGLSHTIASSEQPNAEPTLPSVTRTDNGTIGVEIRPISVEETYPLRRRVLRPGAEEVKFEEDLSESALHLGAFAKGELVGIISMAQKGIGEVKTEEFPATHLPVPEENLQWTLRGLAVATEMQRNGIGTKLLTACEQAVKERGGQMLWSFTRTANQPFYVKRGFTFTGDAVPTKAVGPIRRFFKTL